MSSKPHTDLKTLVSNAYVDGVYSLYNPQLGMTRAGKPYLKCLLRDASGEVAARHWSFEESAFPEIEQAGFVWVAGHTQLYNGQVQLIIEQVRPIEVSEQEMAALLPTTSKNIDEMFGELTEILGSLTHPAIKGLIGAYLGDEDLMRGLRMSPAAVSLHHAWIGGLLEHTLQLIKMADRMLPLYPELNRDLVLTGLFLHDLGKVTELTWEQGFNYTEDGNLIGHVVRGAIWLQVKAAVAAKQSGQRLSSEALRVLQHIIVSHHGEPEYGAMKRPSTPEAVFISQLDDLDAKTQLTLTAARREELARVGDGATFTERIWALDTRIYRPDPLADSSLPSGESTGNQGESASPEATSPLTAAAAAETPSTSA